MHGADEVHKKLFSLSPDSRTRCHSVKLSPGRIRIDKGFFFFNIKHNLEFATVIIAGNPLG